MIRKLRGKNAAAYFSNGNIVKLVVSGDREVSDNVQRQFFKPLVYCANYVTRDLRFSRAISQEGINELIRAIKDGLPITEFADELYCLLWCKIRARTYLATNSSKDQSLKDRFMRGQIMAEVARERKLRTAGKGWFKKVSMVWRSEQEK